MDILQKTISTAASHLKSGNISSEELTKTALAHIEKTKKLNCFIELLPDQAIAAAKASDHRRKEKKTLGPLDGIPVSVKDIFNLENSHTTCASKILKNFRSPYDSTVVKRLKEAGAVIVGKNNMDEFAMGSSNENSSFGHVKNPWNSEYVPGGSSGGSAASVASGQVFGSIGTDTGGSIRQPAAFCGVVGMKPTYGRVSRYGIIAFASSLDQAGPLARSVDDAAILLQTISGYDSNDSTSVNTKPFEFHFDEKAQVKGLRIGLPKEYFQDGLDYEVKKSLFSAIDTFKKLGATFIDVSLPLTQYGIATYYLICTAEASSNLARYDGIRYGLRIDNNQGLKSLYSQSRTQGFGDEVKRRIMLGTYVLSSGYYEAYYRKAQQVRTLLIQDFQKVFESVDLILTPTSPTTAFKIGEKSSDPLSLYLADIYTVTCNLSGLPGLSMPCGFDSKGLPIGMQLLSSHFQEQKIFQAAQSFEVANPPIVYPKL